MRRANLSPPTCTIDEFWQASSLSSTSTCCATWLNGTQTLCLKPFCCPPQPHFQYSTGCLSSGMWNQDLRNHIIAEKGSVQNIDSIPQDIKRSEEHTSELHSLMSNSYAVFCLKKKQ